MRGPSPLSVGDRELIAAYVSGLSGRTYCHGVHAARSAARLHDGGYAGLLAYLTE